MWFRRYDICHKFSLFWSILAKYGYFKAEIELDELNIESFSINVNNLINELLIIFICHVISEIRYLS